MTIRDALRAKLMGNVTVSGLVGTRIFPGFAEQGQPLPQVCLLVVSDVPEHATDGSTDQSVARIQVTCWAATQSAADSLADAVRLDIDGHRGLWSSVFVHSCIKQDHSEIPTDSAGNDEQRRRGIRTDYQIVYQITKPTH